MFEIIYKLGAILAAIGLGLFEIIYELGAILALFGLGLVVFFGLVALAAYTPHLFSMLFVAFLKLIDLITEFINKLEIFETKEKDNTEKIQPLVIEAKNENMTVSELRKEARDMNPQPAPGMAINAANKDQLLTWLNGVQVQHETDVEAEVVEVEEEKEAEEERLIMIREGKIKKRIDLRKMSELET